MVLASTVLDSLVLASMLLDRLTLDTASSALGSRMRALVVPGADWPGWAAPVFGLIGVATIVVLVYQAVRYFRNNRDE